MDRSSIIRIFLATALFILVLLLGVLYKLYRKKQQYKKQLETKRQEINEKNVLLECLMIDKENLIADKNDLLKEKEWLIKEIQHRVRNNLQIVMSLLSAQSEYLNSPSALDAIGKSLERMQVIALIHQKLYQGNSTTRINMQSYISELVESIKNSSIEPGKISFQLNVDEISLDISQSMPLGLILNEAITNAIKYAHPKNKEGIISISLQYADAGKVQLKIADNGKGLPSGFDTNRSNSLGLQLIKLFSEQLDGDLYFINKNGLEIVLNFKPAGYNGEAIKKITS